MNVQKVQNTGKHLPHEMILDILLRLPPKSISKFRCVSKQWYHLLANDNEFISRHSEFSKKKPVLLTRRYVFDEDGVSKTKFTVELTSVDMDGNFADKYRTEIEELVHSFVSCGPLVVLSCSKSHYVCNPSFHEVVCFPNSPKNILMNVGFGYLPITSEYKIVGFYQQESYWRDEIRVCEILTFENGKIGSWSKKVVEICSSIATTCIQNHPICINGIIYWPRADSQNRRSVLSFDMETENFSVIEYPPIGTELYRFCELTGIRGCLAVVIYSLKTSTMEVWLFDNNDKTWLMECCIEPFDMHYVVPSEGEGDEMLIHSEEEGLMIYDVRKQRSIRNMCFDVRSYDRPRLYYYSLSPLTP